MKSYKNPGNWSDKFKDLFSFLDRIKIRSLKQTPLSILVTDKGAILFLNRDEKIDYSECLIDNHPSFIFWIKELFEWYWKKGIKLQPILKK